MFIFLSPININYQTAPQQCKFANFEYQTADWKLEPGRTKMEPCLQLEDQFGEIKIVENM